MFEADRSSNKEANKESDNNILCPKKIGSHQSILGGIAKICSESSTNALLRVIQDSGGFMMKNQSSSSQSGKFPFPESTPIRKTVDRAMGVAALGLNQNVTIAGDQQLRSKIRSELGGAPTRFLNESSETVSHYFQRTGKDNSSSREYRNNLVSDIVDTNQQKKSYSEGLKSNNMDKNKKRVSKRLLQRFRSTKDESTKKKIKYCIKILSSESKDNSMINTVFDLSTNETDSFSSFDVADDLINFVDESDLY